MHRFGRSAQQKMKDRWGGSFILATILALVGAWFAGNWLNDTLSVEAPKSTPSVTSGAQDNTITGVPTPATTEDYKLFFIQVGAFRSESSARSLVQNLSDKGFIAMMAPKSVAGFYKVYGGLYTSSMAASEAKVKLMADGGVTNAITVPVSVTGSAAAIPVTTGSAKGPDLHKGVVAMNTYLYEVAAWVETHVAGNTPDTTVIMAKGKELGTFATELNKAAAKDVTLKPLADMAARASANATEIQTAAKSGPGSTDFQIAMNGYLTLLDQYSALHQGAGAN